MVPIHTILHPTDFSERSDHAFRLASALAHDYRANLVILHVVQQPVMVWSEGMIPPLNDSLESVREELLGLQVPDPVVGVFHRLEEGNPSTEILRVAQAIPADLIVMGTHGRRGLQRLMMGSVTEEVARKALCPVLTIKAPFPDLVLTPDVTVDQAIRS